MELILLSYIFTGITHGIDIAQVHFQMEKCIFKWRSFFHFQAKTAKISILFRQYTPFDTYVSEASPQILLSLLSLTFSSRMYFLQCQISRP